MDQDFSGGRPVTSAAVCCADALNLQADQTVATVGTHVRYGVQRLHGSMREIRHFVHGFDFLRGAREGRGASPSLRASPGFAARSAKPCGWSR